MRFQQILIENVQPGDGLVVYRKWRGYRHVGVAVSDGRGGIRVWSVNKDRLLERQTYRTESIDQFLAGGTLEVCLPSPGESFLPRHTRLARIQSAQELDPLYLHFSNNCESIASWIITGRGLSSQGWIAANTAGLTLAIGLLVFGFGAAGAGPYNGPIFLGLSGGICIYLLGMAKLQDWRRHHHLESILPF